MVALETASDYSGVYAVALEVLPHPVVVFRYARVGNGYFDMLGLLLGLLEVGP